MLRRLFAAGLMAVLLSACAGAGGFGGPTGAPVLGMFDDDVMVAGPRNFCVDTRTSRPRIGFAVLAPCRTLGSDDAGPTLLSVITVQAGAADTALVSGAESTFAQFLKSAPGAALLSGSGDAATVTRRDTQTGQGYVTVIFEDAAPTEIPNIQTTVWRGFLDIGDRLVTVSVRSLDSAPLSRDVGEAVLLQALKALVGVNARTDAPDA